LPLPPLPSVVDQHDGALDTSSPDALATTHLLVPASHASLSFTPESFFQTMTYWGLCHFCTHNVFHPHCIAHPLWTLWCAHLLPPEQFWLKPGRHTPLKHLQRSEGSFCSEFPCLKLPFPTHILPSSWPLLQTEYNLVQVLEDGVSIFATPPPRLFTRDACGTTACLQATRVCSIEMVVAGIFGFWPESNQTAPIALQVPSLPKQRLVTGALPSVSKGNVVSPTRHK